MPKLRSIHNNTGKLRCSQRSGKLGFGMSHEFKFLQHPMMRVHHLPAHVLQEPKSLTEVSRLRCDESKERPELCTPVFMM